MKVTRLPETDGIIRLTCDGKITQVELSPASALLQEALGTSGFSATALLNLEKTNYIDSSGISWLLILHKHFVQAGGRLILHSIPPVVDQVIRLIRLHLVLNLAADEPAALALARETKR